MKLFCTQVGENGRAFSMDINPSHSVGDLKIAIKVCTGKAFPDDLKLFLAKKGGTWLNKSGVEALASDEVVQSFEKNDSRFRIKNTRYFGENVAPSEGEIHVLVVVPSLQAAQVISQHGVFAYCMYLLFSQFLMVDKIDSWLEFSSFCR